MLELPGLTSTGDVGKDLDNLKRYIARLVPALEIELIGAKQDDYASEYNAQTLGVGATDKQTTAGALVAHELRQDNPHHVTAGQLGLTLDKLVTIAFTASGLMARIGDKRGVQINIQDVTVTVSAWTQGDGVRYADTDLGNWEAKMPVLFAAVPAMRGYRTERNYWAGPLIGSGSEQIGTLRIYRPGTSGGSSSQEDDDETYEVDTGTAQTEEVQVNLTMIGLGVYGYGDGEE